MVLPTNRGFTLIELIVVIAITVLLAGIVLFNFRSLRISQEVQAAARELISKIREVQNFVLSGQTRTGGTGGTPQAYEITFTAVSQTYEIKYVINTATTTLDTVSLSQNMEVSALTVGGAPVTPVTLRLNSPFGQMAVNGQLNQTLQITLTHRTGNQSRTVVIDGISGRISSQ